MGKGEESKEGQRGQEDEKWVDMIVQEEQREWAMEWHTRTRERERERERERDKAREKCIGAYEGYKCKESKRAHINRIRAHEKDTGRKIKEV